MESPWAIGKRRAANGWRGIAENDLRFIHETIANHHPGPLDGENPAFAEWHDRGLQESLALLERVRSFAGYRAVVQRYVSGFRDGHLSTNLWLDYNTTGWPRFMVAWRGEQVVVHNVDEGVKAPAVGDVLAGCDGKSVDTLFEERILRYAGKGIPADRHGRTPELLIDPFNPFLDRLRSCTFEHDGATVKLDLDWTYPGRSYLDDRRQRAGLGPRGPFAIRDLPRNGTWISLPTFGPAGDDLDRMKQIMAALPEYRGRDYNVVDVRRNSGGSSYWAEAFVRGLWGDGYYESTRSRDESYAVHRVSAENVEHFQALDQRIKGDSGEESWFYRYFKALTAGMEQALADGQPLYAHHFEPEEEEATDGVEGAAKKSPDPLFRGTVYLLTDATCGSAAWTSPTSCYRSPAWCRSGSRPAATLCTWRSVRSRCPA